MSGLKLLMLAGDYPPAVGGIQNLSHGLGRGLADADHDVRVVASAQPGDEQLDSASGIPTVRCRTPSRVWAALTMALAMRRLLRSGWRPDAVVATKWSPEGQAYLLAGPARRVPLIPRRSPRLCRQRRPAHLLLL